MKQAYAQNAPKVTYDFPDITDREFYNVGTQPKFPREREERVMTGVGVEMLSTPSFKIYLTGYEPTEREVTPLNVSDDEADTLRESFFQDADRIDGYQVPMKFYQSGEQEIARLKDLSAEETHSLRESMADDVKYKKYDLKNYNIASVVKFCGLIGAPMLGAFGERLGISSLARCLLLATPVVAFLPGKLGRFFQKFFSYHPEDYRKIIEHKQLAHQQADKLLFMKNQGQEMTRYYVQDQWKFKNYLTEEQVAKLDPDLAVNKRKQPVAEYEIERSVDRHLVGPDEQVEKYKVWGKVMTEKVAYLPETIEWAKQFERKNDNTNKL